MTWLGLNPQYIFLQFLVRENCRRSKTDMKTSKRRAKIQELHNSLNYAVREKRVFLTTKSSSGRVIHRSLRKRSFVRKLDPTADHIARMNAKEFLDTNYAKNLVSQGNTPRTSKQNKGGYNDADQSNDGNDSDRLSDVSVHSDDDSDSVIEYMVRKKNKNYRGLIIVVFIIKKVLIKKTFAG